MMLVEPSTGIEPEPSRVPGECSAMELRRRGGDGRQPIEPSSPLCESGIFPLDDVPMIVIVRTAGIEPAVSGMSARRSRQ